MDIWSNNIGYSIRKFAACLITIYKAYYSNDTHKIIGLYRIEEGFTDKTHTNSSKNTAPENQDKAKSYFRCCGNWQQSLLIGPRDDRVEMNVTIE